MDKEVLKERLDEVKNQLRTNAKDVHFFDKLIDEALSLKGQMDIEPMFAYLPENEIVDRIKGKNYELVYTPKQAGYRLGGYSIIVQNHYGLGGQIMNYIDTMKDTSGLDEKQKEIWIPKPVTVSGGATSIPNHREMDVTILDDDGRPKSVKAWVPLSN